MNDEIFLDNPQKAAPEVPSSDPNYIKHVWCEGARYHVLSYVLRNGHGHAVCSHPRCIKNKPTPRIAISAPSSYREKMGRLAKRPRVPYAAAKAQTDAALGISETPAPSPNR